MDEISVTADSGAVSMEETNGEMNNINIQKYDKESFDGERKEDGYLQGRNEQRN